MKNVFEFLVQTGMDQLELIGDAEKKATICAELAKAVAQSGLLGMATQEEATEEASKVEPKKAAKKNTKKDALKPEAGKAAPAPAPVEEEAPEVPQEPVQEDEPFPAEEPEFVDEWTEEMCAAKEEQLSMLQAYCEAWGEEYVYNDCLGAFTEGAFSGSDNVRPSNIDGFVIYLQELASQFAGE